MDLDFDDDILLRLPYMRVSQKGISFYISKASAFKLRNVVDFHFREPYREYTNYDRKDFIAIKRELEESGATIENDPSGYGVQRVLNRSRVKEIKKYIEDDPESFFPSSILLAIDTSTAEFENNKEMLELEDSGVFDITSEMHVSVIDGQHRLAGLFLVNEEILQQIEIPVIFMLNVSIPVAAKLFQNINGKQKPVSKSVIFDLFDNVPEEYIDSADDLETKTYHTICVNLYTDRLSPLYRQIKMLGVGGGAISQALFIDACKKHLSCLKNKSLQERYDILYDYFELVQNVFPDDWPKPLGNCTDKEIDEYSKKVLRVEKSQLAKSNGFSAMLMLLNWLQSENRSMNEIEILKDRIDWKEPFGTGAAAQKHVFEKLKKIIESFSVQLN